MYYIDIQKYVHVVIVNLKKKKKEPIEQSQHLQNQKLEQYK